MATTAELQQKLIAKLKELFQLDQPDLDFGFYRVMHVKEKEISDYLENKLPAAIGTAFKDSSGAQFQQDFDAAKQAVLAALGATAINADGSLNPAFAATPMGQQYITAKTALDAGVTNAGGEADVYDHLYHFFERYYDKGDFVSLRYLTRETDRKAKPYAIPYAGEEVMLHWANSDQYYIKTSENFSHYSFDLTKFAAFEKMNEMERMAAQVPSEPLKVHFEIVDAEEGEHGNVKQGKDRFFILHDGTPCALESDGLHIYFEYREDPNMTGQSAKWQEKLRGDACEALKTLVPDIGKAMGEMLSCPLPNSERLPDYVRLLFMELERTKNDGKKEKYTPLAAYLKRYMARNTADYFIHKDLGGFLRRELDFYIKNDLMELDNVVAATPESVAKWLGTLQVFRKIAEDIITFLAQLEDFQKKLWLKKKFIVQCDYCITMDRVPDELKPEVLANQRQLDAWKALNTDVDPKTEDMTAVDARMVDTQYFDESFKQKLLASIDSFDDQCDGVLVHGDNFGALSILQEKNSDSAKCIYIDPPYNTGSDGFVYKDCYGHSCWLSMMADRMALAARLMTKQAAISVNVNDIEDFRLRSMMDAVFGRGQYVTTIVTKCATASSFKTINPGPVDISDRILHYAKSKGDYSFTPQYVVKDPDLSHFSRYVKNKALPPSQWEFESIKLRVLNDLGFVCTNTRDGMKQAKGKLGETAEAVVYARSVDFAIEHAESVFETKTLQKPSAWTRDWIAKSKEKANEVLLVEHKGSEAMYLMGGRQFYFLAKNVRVINGKKYVTEPASTLWMDIDTNNLKHEGDVEFANGKKPLKLVSRFILMSEQSVGNIVLDYFAGSGTTAHAVIDLNRQDGGKRKYILIEMGDHFDTVLMPRVKKVVYSPDWKDGKPTTRTKGISHCFKYFRLESYEDALNNLQVDGAKGAAFAGVSDYFFKYMLEVETKGSPSLLNIEQFSNPFGYKLVVKKPGSEEREERTVDLVETFNYLIGLRVKHTAATVGYNAEFERAVDPELPTDAHTRLTIKGKIKLDEAGPWKFRTVEGWCPKNRATPNDGAKERVLIVWRTLTGDSEKDNAVLNAFLQRKDVNALDGEFDVIYVNGSNNVPNLKKENDVWKVRLIEEDFRARMWEGA